MFHMQNQPHFAALRKNLTDMIKESQIKMGYSGNAFRANYVSASLNRLLGTSLDDDALEAVLGDFCAQVKDSLGAVSFTRREGGFVLTVPAEGTAYVHTHISDSGVLTELVQLLRHQTAETSIADVLAVFRRYADRVHCEAVQDDEFQYLLYFEDGVPDDYRYCIQDEMGMLSYHRLTPADYEDLFIS